MNKNINIEKSVTERIVFWMNAVENKKYDIPEFQKLLDSVKVINWFATYLVYKRIPHEPSIQNTYRKLILRSNIKVLYYEVYKKSMKMIN